MAETIPVIDPAVQPRSDETPFRPPVWTSESVGTADDDDGPRLGVMLGVGATLAIVALAWWRLRRRT